MCLCDIFLNNALYAGFQITNRHGQFVRNPYFNHQFNKKLVVKLALPYNKIKAFPAIPVTD